MKLKHIVILQNKIDLVKEGQAKEQYDQIQKFVQGRKLCYIIRRSELEYLKFICEEWVNFDCQELVIIEAWLLVFTKE